jgi:uncharacterized protein (TIGR02444 family)
VEQDRLRFWTFSLAVYGNAAVQRECLDLQDRCGINVNLLLFCAFVGAVHGAALAQSDVKQAEEIVHQWDGEIVSRLRAVRRALKSFSASGTSAGFNSLYNRVKAQELEAEQLEQRMLECWSAEHLSGWSKAAPSVAVEKNITALFAISVEKVPPPAMPNNLISDALRYAAKWQEGMHCSP